MTPSKTQPVLLGGAFIGVLSALPIVSAANLCCCLWVIGGGVIAAFLMQQNHPEPISTGDGALGGLLAGIVGAFVYAAVSVPIQSVMAPIQRRMVERFVGTARDIPPEMRDMIENMGGGMAGIALMFLLMLFFGVIFSTLGGVLGAVMFRRTPPQPSPGMVDVLPPQG